MAANSIASTTLYAAELRVPLHVHLDHLLLCLRVERHATEREAMRKRDRAAKRIA
jgi:hypothetical protein